MGLYERFLEEVSKEGGASGHLEAAHSYVRSWSLPAPGAGGYVTVEDMEREQERLQREHRRVQEDKEKRASEVRVLRAFARQGVRFWVQGMAFRSLQKKYPAEWDRIRWESGVG